MPKSNRIYIPANIGSKDSFETMRQNADQLITLDTPQALPKLGELDTHTPSRFALLFRFWFVTSIASAILLIDIIIFAISAGLALLAGIQMLSQSNSLGMLAWFILWCLWGGLFMFTDQRARLMLRFKLLDLEGKLPTFLDWGLWPIRLFAWLLALAIFLLGITSTLIVVLYGVDQSLRLVDPLFLEWDVPPLGMYLSIVGTLAIITFLIGRKAGLLPLIFLWGLSVWMLFDNIAFRVGIQAIDGLHPLAPATIATLMSLIYPFQLSRFGATIILALFKHWQSEMLRLFQGWILRDSLSKSFAYHNHRNQVCVANDGGHAICKRDLEYFVQQHAGPIIFWWCPICQDDDQVYVRIHNIQGVLDKEMSALCEQQDHVLRINLLEWRSHKRLPPPLGIKEILIGKLDDQHEVEWFITQYQTMQPKQRNWLPLEKIHALITDKAEIGEHTRRQIQDNMASM